MEDDLLDPLKDERRKIRNVFSTFTERQEQLAAEQAQQLPQLPLRPVTDPTANPFPDVPLPKDFREVPLPPITSTHGPLVGDHTSDIEEELDRHEREAR